jgi:hypothetical protein
VVHSSASAIVAAAYNQSGADYIAYADGDPTDLFAFSGLHAYADRRIWALLEAKWIELRASAPARLAFSTPGAVRVRGFADSSCALTSWGLPPLPRAVLTSRGPRFNERGCWPKTFPEFLGLSFHSMSQTL